MSVRALRVVKLFPFSFQARDLPLTVNSSPLRQRTCLTRRGREGGLADERGGGAGELPARSSVSEVNGGGVFLTDVPDGQKTQRVCRPRATSCSCNLGIRVNLSRLLDFIALRS